MRMFLYYLGRDMMETTFYLSKFPIFRGLSSEHIDALSHIMVEKNFNLGHIIFCKGEEATGFYILISESIEVFKLSSDGKEQILHIFGPGEIFGEVPMFEGKHFPANAGTLEKSRLLFFNRTRFIELIKKEPNLAMNMLAALSSRLRQLSSLIENLSLKKVAKGVKPFT
jgi:CRP-like cAMP-binding protein